MSNLFMNPDGACVQAQCVLAHLRGQPGIDDAYDSDRHFYSYDFIFSHPQVDRWQNCREQGYVIWWRVESKQLNIAFFEHRNSDSICAVMWEQGTINAPTIDTMDTKGKGYKDKYDVSFSVGVGKYAEMADWIMDQMRLFWLNNRKKAA